MRINSINSINVAKQNRNSKASFKGANIPDGAGSIVKDPMVQFIEHAPEASVVTKFITGIKWATLGKIALAIGGAYLLKKGYDKLRESSEEYDRVYGEIDKLTHQFDDIERAARDYGQYL